jgi:hypothetical protein
MDEPPLAMAGLQVLIMSMGCHTLGGRGVKGERGGGHDLEEVLETETERPKKKKESN